MLDINPFEKKLIKPLLLDGAIGSYIQQKGFNTDNILWATKVNYENPELIIQIHTEYIDAGADIITTNTFRTNPASLNKSRISLSSLEYVKQAVSLATQAAEGKNVLVAGSNAPAEDCYQSLRTLSNYELEKNHKNHIDLLIDSNVDFVLNETQSHFDEIKIICKHCDENSIPYVFSLYLDENLKLLSGENVEYVFAFLKDHNPMAIGINCITTTVFQKLIRSTKLPSLWGFYINCGSGNPEDKVINCVVNPDEYLQFVKTSIEYYPSFVGSCCGSNPDHIKSLRKFFNG